MDIVSITDNQNYSGYYPVKSNLTEYIQTITQHTGTRSYTTETTLIENTVLYSDITTANNSTYRTYYTTTQSKTGKASVYPYKTSTSEFTSNYDTTINTYRNDTYNRIFLSEATVSIPPFYNYYSSESKEMHNDKSWNTSFYAKQDGEVSILGDPNNFFSLDRANSINYSVEGMASTKTFEVSELGSTITIPNLGNIAQYFGCYREEHYTAMTGNLRYTTKTSYGYENIFNLSATNSTETTIDGIAYNSSKSINHYYYYYPNEVTKNRGNNYSFFYSESKKTEQDYLLKINDNFYNQSGSFKENNAAVLVTTYNTTTNESSNVVSNNGTDYAILLENIFSETSRSAEFYPFNYSYISTDVSRSTYIDTVSSSSTKKAYYSTSFIKTED